MSEAGLRPSPSKPSSTSNPQRLPIQAATSNPPQTAPSQHIGSVTLGSVTRSWTYALSCPCLGDSFATSADATSLVQRCQNLSVPESPAIEQQTLHARLGRGGQRAAFTIICHSSEAFSWAVQCALVVHVQQGKALHLLRQESSQGKVQRSLKCCGCRQNSSHASPIVSAPGHPTSVKARAIKLQTSNMHANICHPRFRSDIQPSSCC